MILLIVWGFVACYFFVLWYAVGFEMAVGGSILFVFFGLKVTFTVLRPLLEGRPKTAPQPDPSLPANQNQPPRR